MSLWENDESERQERTQRILIIVGSVAAILIIFWVMRNAILLASQPRNGVGFAGSGRARRLMDPPATEGVGKPAPRTASAPAPSAGSPSGVTRYTAPAAPAYIPPPPPQLIGGAYAPQTAVQPVATTLSPEEQAQAKAAVAPLRKTLSAVRDFDRKSFWNHSGSDGADFSGSVASVDAAVDGLGAMIGLYGHPDRFPKPVRGTAGTAATGMRSYLRLTLSAAATNDPTERQRLRPAAEQRLAEADAAVRRLEGGQTGGQTVPGVAAN